MGTFGWSQHYSFSLSAMLILWHRLIYSPPRDKKNPHGSLITFCCIFKLDSVSWQLVAVTHPISDIHTILELCLEIISSNLILPLSCDAVSLPLMQLSQVIDKIDQMNQQWRENIHHSSSVNALIFRGRVGCCDQCGQWWGHSSRPREVIMHIIDFPYY